MGRHRSSPTRCATPYTLYFTAPPGLLHDRLRSAICSAFYFLNLHLNTSPLVSRDSPIRRSARGVETARDHSFAASYSSPNDDLVLLNLALHQLASRAITSDDSEIQAASGRHSTSLTRSASLTTLLQAASVRHPTSLTRSASLTSLQTSSSPQTSSRSRNIRPNLDHPSEESDLLSHIEQTSLRTVFDAGSPTPPVPPSSSRTSSSSRASAQGGAIQGCSYETLSSTRFLFLPSSLLTHLYVLLRRRRPEQSRGLHHGRSSSRRRCHRDCSSSRRRCSHHRPSSRSTSSRTHGRCFKTSHPQAHSPCFNWTIQQTLATFKNSAHFGAAVLSEFDAFLQAGTSR